MVCERGLREDNLEGAWRFCWRHWFWQIRSGELGRFGVVYVDCELQSTIFVNCLVFVRDAADSIGSFPSRPQLGGTFWEVW